MNEQEKIIERIKELEQIKKFLSDHESTERWVVAEFLSNFGIRFELAELEKSAEEPVDIKFREANFQVKTINDDDRKMHQECKDDLIIAKKAESYSETLNFRGNQLKEISLQEIANLISEKLVAYILSPEQYKKIDLLFYFNRIFQDIIGDLPYSFSNKTFWQEWRSISLVDNTGVNFVYWAREDAPEYIRENMGKLLFKKK